MSIKAGRNDVGISGLDTPIIIEIPTAPLLENETNNDFGPQVVQSCKYFDKDTQLWSTEGCMALNTSTNVTTYCACTHLTDFGAGDAPKPNKVDLNPVAMFSKEPNLAMIFCIIIVSILFTLYVLAMIYARRADKREEKAQLAKLATDSGAMSEDTAK